MKVFSADVPLFATVYVTAENEDEAADKIAELSLTGIEFSSRRQMIAEDLYMTGETFTADMPEISLSPALTFGEIPAKLVQVDFAEDLDKAEEEDGE